MVKWQYKRIVRSRGFPPGEPARTGNDFSPAGDEFDRLINKLGDEGWELVSVVTYADFIGDFCTGFTSSDVWVFKRPKM